MKHYIFITVGDKSSYLINDWRVLVILTFTVTGTFVVPVADGLVTVPAGILIVSVALFTRLLCKDLFFRLFVYGSKVFFKLLLAAFLRNKDLMAKKIHTVNPKKCISQLTKTTLGSLDVIVSSLKRSGFRASPCRV